MVNGYVRRADPTSALHSAPICIGGPSSDEPHRLGAVGEKRTPAGSRFKRLGSHRAGRDPLKMVSSNSDAGPPEVPASKWRLGVDGVTLDESRIWKSHGGMWQVKPEASGL